MKISIFGLGYVGAVSAACLANDGHTVIGVDAYKPKVDMINNGMTPIIEKDVGELIQKAVASGLLCATQDIMEAVSHTDISMICVGTPNQSNGNLDLKYIRTVCKEIGTALKNKDDFHVVVARSTMLPGSMHSVVIPFLEEYSGKKAGIDFGVCINPEFLREGTSVFDYYNPPKTVIGETDPQAGDLLAQIYAHLDAHLIRTRIETAEMAKYVDNAWHGLKIAFANEIGNLCKGVGIDGHQVMDIFCKDLKLNLSSYYLKPGFAFGGSCLPKDIRALTYKAKSLDINTPVLSSIMVSNQNQIERGLKMIIDKGSKKVGILGFSFKAGTDDLRESPMVEVIERLIGKGYDIQIYDKNVSMACLVGANKDYILNRIPHISRLMVDSIDSVLEHADTVVIGNHATEFGNVPERITANQVVVDLVRITEKISETEGYDGICW